MKRVKIFFGAGILLSVSMLFIQGESNYAFTENELDACEIIDQLQYQELNDSEKEALLLMIEEEKLARDVYTTFSKVYDSHVFTNISEAEDRHMNAIQCMLNKYDLKNPVQEKAIGVYSNRKFTDLYESFVIRGKTELKEALMIGATIEDMDLKDLNDLMESKTTDNDDLKAVIRELQRGTRNHMRAFSKNLKKQEASYDAQFISKEEYREIVSASQERGGWLCGDEKPRDSKVNKKCKGDHSKCSGACKGEGHEKKGCKDHQH